MLHYGMIFLLELQFATFECLLCGLADEFPSILRKYKIVFTAVSASALFLLGLPLTTQVNDPLNENLRIMISSILLIMYYLKCKHLLHNNSHVIFQGGMYVFNVFDNYSATFSPLFVAFIETLVVSYVYG